MKVLYIVNVPAPYMVNYFNELGKYCDLTVIFEKDRSTERDKSWLDFQCVNFKPIILKGISTAVDMAFAPQIVRYLKKGKYDFIFISNMASLTGIMAITYLKLRKIPYFLESEGGFAKDGKGFKEKFKRFLMRGAEKYFSTTPVGDEYFLQYGANADQLVKYPFTSIYDSDILENAPSDEEKQSLRKELGIKEEKVIISVGQFIHRKGYDVLLNAGRSIPSNVGVYIIGGEPTEEYLKMKSDYGLDNFHFVGFCNKEQLSKYYKAADLFVLPTREDIWGLVINEAMAYALPVITTDRCIAGLELVKNDENGYIVAVEDAAALADRINYVINSNDLLKQMGKNSAERIKWYTFESMAKVHIDYLRSYTKNGS